jgi:pimeloyl-ACP methyl ester carboxylesterase
MRVDLNGIGLNVAVTGDGPAVLLLHGWPDHHAVWRHQVAAFLAAGYRSIAPDLRGFGESDKPAAVEDYGSLQVIGDLLGILDHLGVSKAHVVGHDWGWGVRRAARRHGPRAGRQPDLPVGRPPGGVRRGRLGAASEVVVHAAVQFRGVAEACGAPATSGSPRRP